MYEAFYGLTSKPFQLNPDPSFYFGSKQHSRARAYLEYGISRNEGFVVVTGEIGAGKTTILRTLIDGLHGSNVVIGQLVTTQLDAEDTLRMVGANYGLSGLDHVRLILLPAAFPSILAGLKIGWAFAWRTLIAAELVFGVSSGSGGLGWFIFANKNTLEIPSVFAGLLMVILIGLVVENLIFRTIEHRTVRRWGMQS